MVVDKRHDHSFRVPRPDLSDKLQTSNACTDCHKDKPAAWAARPSRAGSGLSGKGLQTYGEAFHAAWNDAAGRGSAASRRRRGRERTRLSLVPAHSLGSRLMSLRRMLDWRGRGSPIPTRWSASPRSTCSTACRRISFGRSSRQPSPIRSAACACVQPRCLLALRAIGCRRPSAQRSTARRGVLAAQALNADRPEARATLGNFHARRGETDRR